MLMDRTTLMNLIQQPEFLMGLLAGLIVALLLALLLRALQRPPTSFEAFSNESGKVVVSKQALQDQIQRCCEELGDVGKARACVLHKNGLLSIKIRLRVRSNAKLIGISGYIQEQIGAVLRKNLGIENIGPIDIVVTGILPSSQEQATSIKPEEKAAE